jgi:2-polyprenyl-6-hydroxyphenyl methylase/3-demethylubiquinone-9 3-methyltransferase
MTQSWYDTKDPHRARELYLASHDNLYDRTKIAVIARVMRRVYRSLQGLDVLEVGPGGGIWTAYFLEAGARVTCVDTLAHILKANKRANPGAETITGDATIVRIGKQFDLVFAKDVIEHIHDDQSFLRNMYVHLKEGGRIVINTQNAWSLNFLIQGSYHYVRGNRSWYGWDPTHVRFYHFASLRKKLGGAGFRAEAWFGSYYFPYRLLADHLSPVFDSKAFCPIELSRLSDYLPVGILGWNLGVVAKKCDVKR